MSTPERIPLPNGWHFRPINSLAYRWKLCRPDGIETSSAAWSTADARAFAAALSPPVPDELVQLVDEFGTGQTTTEQKP